MIERIGIVGGGQLGRMLTEAAHPLGYHVTVLDASPNCPAAQVGAEQLEGGLQDIEKLVELAQKNDVITWEIEHIAADRLAQLAEEGYNIESSPVTLQKIQDKFEQKQLLDAAGIPIADYAEIPVDQNRQADFDALGDEFGYPFMVKSRKGAYDGRGNHVFHEGDVLGGILLYTPDRLYAERMVPFEKELSVIAARDKRGAIAVYPVVETVHKDNICHTVLSPANIDPKLRSQAEEIGHETMKLLGGAGVFAIEMFATDTDVLINEIAPRVHNSGHQTIEANVTSQFEQHIRAITGMPLGSTALRVPASVMINILGQRAEPLSREGLDKVLALPDTHPHFYGKSSRPARKIGHITVLGASIDEVLKTAQTAREALTV